MKKTYLLLAGIAVVLLGIAGYTMLAGQKAGTVETVAEIEEPETAEKEAEATPTPVPSPTPVPTTEPAEESKEDSVNESLREESGEESEAVEIEVNEMDAEMYAVQNVNLRSENAVTSEALRTIAYGEKVHVTGHTLDKQWFRVEDTEKGTGYVASSYLSETKPVQNQSEVQRQNPTADGSLPADPAVNNAGGNKSGNGGGSQELSPEAQALIQQLAEQQTGYDQTGENAGEGHKGAGRYGSINQ